MMVTIKLHIRTKSDKMVLQYKDTMEEKLWQF